MYHSAIGYIFIILCFLSCNEVFASPRHVATNTYKFHTLSPEGGFYYDGISSITQDNDGFIWFTMQNDLYRFDGYEFKRYHNYFKTLDTEKKWYFGSAFLNSAGNLFVPTNNGLYVYNKETETFDRMFTLWVNLIKEDSKGNLWINAGSIGRFDLQKRTFFGMEAEGKLLTGITTICTDNEEVLAGNIKGEIFRYDYRNEQFRKLLQLPEEYEIIDIKRDERNLWVLTDGNGLFQIDILNLEYKKTYDFYCTQDNEFVPAKTLYLDKEGKLWIGTQRGLYIIDPVADEYVHCEYSQTDMFSLPNSSIWNIVEDNQQNVWISTYAGGLAYLNFRENSRFRTYSLRPNELNHNVVSAFAEDGDYIWIATEGGGINRWNRTTGRFDYFAHNSYQKGPTYDNVKTLVMTNDNELWAGMYRGGLDCYDRKSSSFKNMSHLSRKGNSPLQNDIRKIVLEPDSGMWLTYHSNGISFYSFERDHFDNYYFDGLTGGGISDVCRGKGDQVWVINRDEFILMDARTRRYEKIPLDSISYVRPQVLCVDTYGDVWIGTVGSGLIFFDTFHYTFRVIDEILKFNVTTIYSISEDLQGNLWLGTDNGLFRYERAEEKFTRFDKKDGIQGLVFYPTASFRGQNGELYFGGTNGFTVFNPKEVDSNTFRPAVILTEVLINNETLRLEETAFPIHYGIIDTGHIELNYKQINLSFKVTCNNYLLPEKNRFRYRLKGKDTDWTEIDASQRIISFSDLPAGRYTLEILAANNDGLWSENPALIYIHRKPAPWLRIEAYLIYFLLSIGIMVSVYYYYDRQRKLKIKLYIETEERQRKEEIHRAQLRFFTNISHDFRTPLSLIMAAIYQMKQNIKNNYHIEVVDSNAKRLLNLINELMDFRTIENGKMKLRVECADLNDFVNKIARGFTQYAVQRRIEFHIKTDETLHALLPFDKQIMEKILMNLLNNAFKYTGSGGEISVEVYGAPSGFKSLYTDCYSIKEQPGKDEGFLLVVRDTGVGISSESIRQVFERFYRVESTDPDAHIGSGIGLALVKSLVTLHQGNISVYSARNKGTDMVVWLPNDISIYKPDELLSEEEVGEQFISPVHYTPEELPEKEGLADEKDQWHRPESQRILFVEDNNDLRRLIVEFLSVDYEIIEAENGLVATHLLAGMEIDLIISDIMMPLKDGITLCREVKDNIQTSHIPFIILTAKGGLPNQVEGLESGADVYFEKPVDPELLLITIRNVFKRQQKLKEYYSRNYFLDRGEVAVNQKDNRFMEQFIAILESHIDQPDMDINFIASSLSMSRSKLYAKIKALTGKSIIEFIKGFRLRKAATLLVEENLSIREVMDRVGIESQSYFTRSFKAEYGSTPTQFIEDQKKK